jgi:RNA polymerase sigma-70 factor (ECF subfamily)
MRLRDFETAVARHQRKVFTFAHYFLSHREEAEDVTQEVFIRLWRNRHKVEPEHLGTWLLKVTRNACYDRLRRRRTAAGVMAPDPDGELSGQVASLAPDPEMQAHSAQLGGRLVSALNQLPRKQRSVIILREIQGLSYQDISEVLDLPLSSVKVSLHRGRQQLREQLGEVQDHALAS